jgi:hypothetical protein
MRSMADGIVRLAPTEVSDLRDCSANLWAVVHREVTEEIGCLPIVAWGRREQIGETWRGSRWIPMVFDPDVGALVGATSLPGLLGIVLVPGPKGQSPDPEWLLSMVEEE